MPKNVLSVGQCHVDGPALRRLLQDRFGADVTSARNADLADKALADKSFDLILVNREFDADGASGLDFIRKLKQSGEQTPVMLVSGHDDAQKQAVEAGALRGFDKAGMKEEGSLPEVAEALGA